MTLAQGSVGRHRGAWTARIHFVDPSTGKRREIRRKARSRAEACDLRDKIVREVRETGEGFAARERKTVADLIDYYEAFYAQPPQYVDGRKVLGMRAHKDARGYARIVRGQLGSRLLRTITYGDLLSLKQKLISTRTRQGRTRSIANVNRILSTFRRMLNIAYRENWIYRNPFASGDPLISVADERKRQRILSYEEELRLLRALEHPRRAHARPVVICALDTGMRFGEIITLQWKDVDLENEIITIQAFHTKTMTTRQVAITGRLADQLRLLSRCSHEPSERVFGIKNNIKNSFNRARDEAATADLRFHDLRHTAATRLTQGHLPLAEVGRILGHSDPKTTFRYVNTDTTTLLRGRDILDQFHRRALPGASSL